MRRISSRSVGVMVVLTVTIALLGFWGFNPSRGSALPTGLRTSPLYAWPDLHMDMIALGLLFNPDVKATYEYFRSRDGHWKATVVESDVAEVVGDYRMWDGENLYTFRPLLMEQPRVTPLNSKQHEIDYVLRPAFANHVAGDLDNGHARLLENEEVAGYATRVVEKHWVDFDGKEWVERIWIEAEHGIPLRYEVLDDGEIAAHLEVISLTIDAPLPESIFEPVS